MTIIPHRKKATNEKQTTNNMNYITNTKKEAKQLAQAIKSRSNLDCEITKDGKSWRVSNNTISGDYFVNIALEIGV